MEERQDPLLQRDVEVDQQVAAANQIEPRKRRVAKNIVLGEDTQLANGLADLILAVDLGEKAAQALGADVDGDVFEIRPRASFLQRGVVNVRGQQLDRRVRRHVAQD